MMGFFLFVFYFYFKHWMLEEISMFHIVLCLLIGLKEDGKGGFSWDLGRILKSFFTAIVGLVAGALGASAGKAGLYSLL